MNRELTTPFLPHEPHGTFTVNSVYRVLSLPRTENLQVVNFKWNLMWNLKLPSKIRLFIWHMIMDIMPTKSKLLQCHAIDNDLCPIYFLESEIITHVLFECVFAKRV